MRPRRCVSGYPSCDVCGKTIVYTTFPVMPPIDGTQLWTLSWPYQTRKRWANGKQVMQGEYDFCSLECLQTWMNSLEDEDGKGS